jgi:hypothetical protein
MALIKLNEANENEEKRAKNEKKMAEKSKLVMLVTKPAMTRSHPPKVEVQRTEKTLDDSEVQMLKYLGVNLNNRPDPL